MRKKIISKKFLSIIAAVVVLAAVIATPVLASPATATRTLPASVVSGANFDVTIQPSDCGVAGQVEETLPPGFTYLGCTPPETQVEEVGNTITFTFLDSESFTYTVRAPIVATTTTYTFHGVVKDWDRIEYPIQDSVITVTAPGAVTHTLIMVVSGNGSTIPPVGSHIYDAGVVVDISATPDSGWWFDHWSSNVADLSSSSTTVTMNSNKTVTSYFVQVSGSRTLPSSVASGAEFNVAIEALGCGIWGQVIETLPSGFTYVSSSLPAGQVEQLGNTVKFTFLDSTSFTFTYKVKAPRVADTTTYTFQGRILDEDRISYPMEDDNITVLVTSGTRTPPSSVASGAEFNVAIEALGCGVWGQVIETLPDEFTYVSSSLPADQVEQVGNTVKFSFFDSASFTYKVKAPTVDATSTYTFQGKVLDEDRTSYPIEDDEITVTVETPATAPPIGGKGYFPSMLGLLIPWMALGVVLMGGITWFVLRRRKA